MEQLVCNQTDLANVVGLKSRVSESLHRKRKLSLEMIRLIHNRLNIPTEVLIKAYQRSTVANISLCTIWDSTFSPSTFGISNQL